MKAIILKCKPNAMFHLGKLAIDEDTSLNETSEIIHSDTLFSALVNIYDKIFADTDTFVQLFRDSKAKISSGFYCLETGKNDFIYFLPKPPYYNLAKIDDFKKYKKIKYISWNIWKQGIHPSHFFEGPCVVIDKKFVCISEGEVKKLEETKIYSVVDLPKVAIHKPTKEDSLYYQTNIQIVDNGSKGYQPHFYFLLDDSGLNSTQQTRLENCLHILADTGIGGERSTGCGSFAGIQIIRNFSLFEFNNPNYYASLSLFSPLSEAELAQAKYYQTIIRGGRRLGNQDSKQYLKQVRMITEGALLESNQAKGTLADVSYQKDIPFFRYGIPFYLPIHPDLKF